jgi:hypothetical protein
MLGVPFTDYLNVTVPSEIGLEVVPRVLPLIESMGPMSEEEPGLYRLYDSRLRPTGAVFKFRKRGKVLVLSASGMALDALRHSRIYGDYLSEISVFPHRVSMLHATQDYFVSSPPSVVLAVKDAAFAEELSLTRKRLLKGQVKVLLSPDASGSGLDTGTVYLGHRKNADVWAKVYDKRHERLQKGFPDPGPILRVEIAVQSDIGATLKDAHNPHDIFFNFASKSLVEAPSSFQGWVANGEGYALRKSVEILPHDRLDRLLGFSLDVTRLIQVAVAMYGDKAGDVLSRHVMKKCQEAYVASEVASCTV